MSPMAAADVDGHATKTVVRRRTYYHAKSIWTVQGYDIQLGTVAPWQVSNIKLKQHLRQSTPRIQRTSQTPSLLLFQVDAVLC